MDERNAPMPLVPQHSTHPLVVLWSLIGGMLLLVFLLAGMIAAGDAFVRGATVVVYILVALAVLIIPGGVIAGLILLYQAHRRKTRIQDLEIERAQAAIQREDDLNAARIEQINAQTDVIRRTIAFDSVGNAAVLDPYTGRIIQLRGNYQEHPNLHTYHNAPRYDRVVSEETPEQAALPAPDLQLPRIEQFYDAIEYNSLQTGMGMEATTGKLVIVPIVQSVHFKLIGGSGQGKSCVAGSILDIATTTNDPDHLRIGLLDLEHNTSRLFENLPHIAEIGPRRQRLVGRDPDEVAQKLKLLQWELSRRAGLGEEHCTLYEPLLLVYVEEMLALKYEVVDEKLKKEMLAAINVLGVRARKYGIFLLVCMQVDYSDKSTREAMAQFRTRAGFAIDPEAARASGFFNTELVKQNFQSGRPGQYVLERPSYSSIVLSPEYNVKKKLAMLSATSRPAPTRPPIPFIDVKTSASEVAKNPPEGDAEGAIEGGTPSPLQDAPPLNVAAFTPQEQRIIKKFLVEGLGVSQIVASEYTNGKGQPLTGGEAFKQRSREVQDILRRAFNQEAS